MACLHKNKLWDNLWCPVTCFYCTGEQQMTCEHNKATNGDRIRAMSDEDLKDSILAVHLGYNPWCDYHCENKGDDGCDRCIEKWLKQPAEEGADNG